MICKFIKYMQKHVNKSGDLMSEVDDLDNKLTFDECFSLYLDYIDTHKTTAIDYYYSNPDGIQLGMWVKGILNIKIYRGLLENKYIDQLRQLKYECMIKPLYWDEWFELAVRLIPEHKNYEYSIIYENIYQVGMWLRRQIKCFNKLTPQQKEKFSSIYRRGKFLTTDEKPEPVIIKNKSSKASDPRFRTWQEQWVCYIERLRASNDKLSSKDVLWIEYRLADYFSIKHVGVMRTLLWYQPYELCSLLSKLIINGQIEFIDTMTISAPDFANLAKRLIEKYESNKTRKDFLLNFLDTKYITHNDSLAERLRQEYYDVRHTNVQESSILSISDAYVNTVDNDLSACRYAKDLRSELFYDCDV